MEADAIDLVERAIAIGQELVKVCDAVGQPIAANHIALALEILAGHCEAMRVAAGSTRSDGLGDEA